MPLSHLLIVISLLFIPLCLSLLAVMQKWRTFAFFSLRLLIGWGLLYIFEKYCGPSGINLSANFFTVGCFGTLGLPGFGVLLMLRYMYII